MGDAMMIPYTDLPSSEMGWRDGLHWLEEVREWSLEYEKRFMVPATTNKQLAESHLDVLFFNLSGTYVRLGKRFVTVLLGKRLRKAMM